jgi:hypothetical protein
MLRPKNQRGIILEIEILFSSQNFLSFGNFGHHILATKFWPPNFGHQILATKFLFVRKLATNREARKILKFGQRLQRNLKNCGCVWMNWDETCHYLGLPVEFGQRLQLNLKNCRCLWSNWDKSCHQLCLPVKLGQRLWHNLKNCRCVWLNWDETCH